MGTAPAAKPQAQFRLRIRAGDQVAIGPGKVALLESVAQTGSITGAARALGMSYRRAWLLIDEMNRCLREPAMTTSAGGPHGGGAALTPVGEEIVRRYRAVESGAHRATRSEIAALARLIRT